MMHYILSDDAVRMEYFRRYPASTKSRFWSEFLVMIRSSGGLWREKGRGYTNKKSDAGLFTLQNACSHTFHCGPEKHVVFLLQQGGDGDRVLPTQEAENYYVERAKWDALSNESAAQ